METNIVKNIIVVYDCAFVNGGGAKVAIQSAISLSEMNLNVCFFSAVGPIGDELEDSNVNVCCLGMDDINHGSRLVAIKNGIWNKKASKEFEALLSGYSNKDTIIHIHGWAKALSSSIIKAANNKGYKIVITLHDYFTVCPNGGFYDYKSCKTCTKSPMSVACIFCNCDKRNYLQKIWRVLRQVVQDRNVRNNPSIFFISISEKNEEVIKPYVKSKSFFRIRNPIDLPQKEIRRQTYSKIFIYVGRISEEKGTEVFCKAVEALIDEQVDINGIVIGDGALHDYLRQKYKRIQFVGWKTSSEVKNYYQMARALVLPSKWFEGAPLNIIEAMAAGVPCIVSDCTSAVEVIEEGKTGEVFQSGNIADLKDKIIKLLNDDYLSELCRYIDDIDLNSLYGNDVHIKSLLSVYNKLLKS